MNTTVKNRLTIYRLCTVAMFAAVMCLLSPWAIPLGHVPITLGTLAVFLTAGTLGPVRGTCAVLVYLAIGAVGLPVFSGMKGGAGVLFGYTGGFLWGYLPAAAVIGFSRRLHKIWSFPPLCVLGTLLCYLCGTFWYMHLAGVSFAAALGVCVVPFLAFDASKIVLATLLLPALWRAADAMERRLL